MYRTDSNLYDKATYLSQTILDRIESYQFNIGICFWYKNSREKDTLPSLNQSENIQMKYSIKLGSVKINDIATIEGLEFQVEYAPEEIKVLVTEILPFIKDMVNIAVAFKESEGERREELRESKNANVASDIRDSLHTAAMALLLDDAKSAKVAIEHAQDKVFELRM